MVGSRIGTIHAGRCVGTEWALQVLTGAEILRALNQHPLPWSTAPSVPIWYSQHLISTFQHLLVKLGAASLYLPSCNAWNIQIQSNLKIIVGLLIEIMFLKSKWVLLLLKPLYMWPLLRFRCRSEDISNILYENWSFINIFDLKNIIPISNSMIILRFDMNISCIIICFYTQVTRTVIIEYPSQSKSSSADILNLLVSQWIWLFAP